MELTAACEHRRSRVIEDRGLLCLECGTEFDEVTGTPWPKDKATDRNRGGPDFSSIGNPQPQR